MIRNFTSLSNSQCHSTSSHENPPKKLKPSSLIESVSYLTKMGISNYEDGDQEKAKTFFAQALCRVDHQFHVRQMLLSSTSIESSQMNNNKDTKGKDDLTDSQDSSREQIFDEGMHVYKEPLHIDQTAPVDEITSMLSFNIGLTHSCQGQYKLAITWFEQSLLTLQTSVGVAPSQQAIMILHNLGHCNYKLKLLVEAWSFYQQALTVACQLNVQKRKDIAICLNCMAVLNFHKENHDDNVMKTLQKSLDYHRMDSDHQSTIEIATVLNNIGRIYYLRKEFVNAAKHYEEALQIRRDVLGTKSIDVAATLYNLGQSYHQIAQFDKSIEHYEEFLSIMELTYGPNSRFAALGFRGIAEVQYEQSNLNDALHFFRKALNTQLLADGGYNQEVCSTLNKLGNVCFEMEDFNTAMSYYEKGLDKEKELYPMNHPHIIVTQTNIAHIYKTLGKFQDALIAYKRVYEMQITSPNRNYEKMADTLSCIGLMYFQLKDFDGAFESFQRGLRLYREVHKTDEHLNIASSLNYVGLVLFKRAMFDTSKECFYESLRIRQKLLGSDHRDVATIWFNLATILFETGESELAIKYYNETLRIERKTLGSNHPDVVASIERLGQVLQGLGRLDEALDYFTEALTIERNRTGCDNTRAILRILNLIGNFHLQQGNTNEMMKAYVEASRIYESSDDACRESLVIMGYNLYGMSKTHPPCAPVA